MQNTTPTPPRPESPFPSGDSRQGSVQNTTPTPPRVSVPIGMVLIPGGEFQMGSSYSEGNDDEKPVHTVYVDAFYMDKYEVTNAQFKAFVDADPQWRKDRIPRAYHNGHYLNHWTGNRYPNGKSDHPVVYVSWYAAMAYAQWKGKRLPTEAEWEKAARGGLVGQNYPWGNGIGSNRANFGYNVGKTTYVGSYTANGYGLYDMAGNVWEWCLDGYDADFYARSPRRNPVSGAENPAQIVNRFMYVESNRVLRGGSWSATAIALRVADRFRYSPTYTSWSSGFRCARDVIKPQEPGF